MNTVIEKNDMSQMNSFESFREKCSKDFEYDLTELGNAKRLLVLLERKIVWVDSLNKFAVFKKGRWEADNDGVAMRTVELILSDLDREIEYFETLKKQTNQFTEYHNIALYIDILNTKIKSLKRHRKVSQSSSMIKNSLTLYKSMMGITKSMSSFDCKGKYIGVLNGVINLKSGELIESDPRFLMMKSTGISYDSSADCPQWLDFLNTIMEGDKDKIEYLHLLAGQMLIGDDCKDKLTILIGDGANGKSVFLDTLTNLLGDYTHQVPPDLLTGKGSSKEYHLAKLQGKRCISMVETKRGDRLEESLVKMIVDSGRISARFPYGQPFDFQPVFTPVLCTNHMPYISSDPATWRRLVIIPFDYTIPEEERDPNFKSKLIKEEGQGIFNWMVKGAVKHYANNGIKICDSLKDTLNRYKREFDNVAHFIVDTQSDYLDDNEITEYKCKISDLRLAYSAWCKKNGYHPLGQPNFKKELLKKGYDVRKGEKGLIHVFGIKLIDINGEWRTIAQPEILERELLYT